MKLRSLVAIAALTGLVVPMSLLAMSHGKEMPAAEGKALYQYITQTDSYEKWPMWPGKKEFYSGTEPHGALLTTYVNEPALQALQKNAPLPDGAIIVKENYTPDKKLAAVTVMYKKAGFNPQAGDYFWLKYGPQGKIEAEGKADGCINCHRAAQGNDFLFTNDQQKK
ncbi:MAG: cytochrome P460 family protein [Desulfuromonadales bacterium]|nr:cytochrome P460 family protein [Desulfuromonadales bacterium]